MLACTGRRSRLGCSSKHGPPGGNLQTRELLSFLLHTLASKDDLSAVIGSPRPAGVPSMPEKPSKD